MANTNHLRQQTIDDEEIPALVRKFLAAGADLEDIRLNARGEWMHQDEHFINKKLSQLFHRSLHQTSKGTWYLQVNPYTYPVTVELTHQFIDRLQHEDGATKAHIVGKDPNTYTDIDLQDLYTDGDEIIAMRHNDAPTRFVGQAYRDLLLQLNQDGEQFYIEWHTQRLNLAPMPDDFFQETASP